MKLNFSGFFPRVVFLFFILLCIFEIQAQSFEPIKSKGQVPDVFLKVSSQEFERKVEEAKNKKHRKRYERKAEEEFHLSVSYFMHEVLFSGRVLFGDPVTAYINKVTDELLKKDQELEKAKENIEELNRTI